MTLLVDDFISRIIGNFGNLSAALKNERHQSPRGLDNAVPKEVLHKLHSRKNTRSSKLIGDLYILSGAYGEAMSVYVFYLIVCP